MSAADAPPRSAPGLLPAAMERAADAALAALRHAPALALITTIAALFELAMARVGWHGLTDLASPETVREIGRMARFPRNLAGVGGSVALVLGLLQFLRFPSFAPVGRRLAVAAFAGIFVPCILVATYLPHASLKPRLVIFGLAAANVLTTLLGLSALRFRAPLGLRVAVVGASVAAFLTLVWIGMSQILQVEGGALAWLAALMQSNPGPTQTIHLAIRHVGELGWMAVLLGGAWTATFGEPGERSRPRVAVALFLWVVFVAAFLAGASAVGHRFPIVVFGTLRLMLALESAPELYAVPLAAGLAGGLVGLAHRRPETRQVGMAVLLWLCAGYGPHTPIQLLYFVLAATLLVRSAQAYDPRGVWRGRAPWRFWLGR